MTIETTCAIASRVLLNPDASVFEQRRAVAHQQSCPLCASMADIASDLSSERDVHFPDQVLGRLSRVRPAPSRLACALLALMAVAQGVFSLPWVLGHNPLGRFIGTATPEHLTRDGALGVLVSVAGIVTAWRPRYSYAMLAVCGAIVVLQLGAGAVDEHGSAVGLHFEIIHVLALAIASAVGLIAFRRPQRR
jgi:hypothetical protein